MKKVKSLKLEVKKALAKVKGTKVTHKNFYEEGGRFKRFFNAQLENELAERSVKCKAGRLELSAMLYKGKLATSVFTHPKETPFETEVFLAYYKSFDEAVTALKVVEKEYKNKKTWCEWLYEEGKKSES